MTETEIMSDALRSSEIQVRSRCLDPAGNEASLVRMAFVQGALWHQEKSAVGVLQSQQEADIVLIRKYKSLAESMEAERNKMREERDIAVENHFNAVSRAENAEHNLERILEGLRAFDGKPPELLRGLT